jgi:hypothetical protein
MDIDKPLVSSTIQCGVDLNPKKTTIIRCMAGSGEHIIPYVVTLQESEKIWETPRKKSIEFRGI